MKNFCILLIILLCVCCTENRNVIQQLSYTDSVSNYLKSIVLEENIDFIGKSVSDFCILSDSTYLLSTPHSLYVYSLLGNQLGVIGKQGEGPEEYMNIGEIYLTNDYIYVWCSVKRKLFMYDKTGKYQKNFPLPHKKIISMCVYQDRYLCCMLDGTGEGEIVEIFDMFDLKSLRTIFLDSKEMRVLSCAQVAGSIEIIDHLLYWSIPSELSFSVLDLNDIDGDITKYDIKDNDFFIEQFRSNNGSAHGKNILEYINSNSRILQLYCRKNTINLVAEVGTIEQDWNNKIVDYSKRFVKIYQVSNSGILKKTYRFKIYENYGLVKLCDDGLYVLKAEYNKDDFIIMLDKYSL